MQSCMIRGIAEATMIGVVFRMLPYALIGAGPMGLCTARQLAKHNVSFHGFELHSDVGGPWDISNPHRHDV